jgi:YVTN family beta-propeller protein
VIDTASNTITAIISAGGSFGVAITPDGRHAYVTNFGSGTTPGIAKAIDTATNTVVTGVLAGKGAFRVAVAPDGRHAYIANQEEATASVIRTLPVANSIVPAQGLATNTIPVKISGARLDGPSAVNFGPNPATNLVANAAGTELTATSPTGSPGIVPVTVTTPGGTSNPVSFTYGVPPTISTVLPNQGPVNGGTNVTITGTGLSGVTAVNFGPNPASNPVANAAGTELSAISPTGAAGMVSVTVTTPGGTSNPIPYTYVVPPTITSIVPTQGPASGGTPVIINGTRLLGTATVHFGDNLATNVFAISAAGTQLLATSPAGDPGTVSVTVTTPDGTSNATPFSYS